MFNVLQTKYGTRILITILQFTITEILGDSDAYANSVYQAAFLPSLRTGIEATRESKLPSYNL